MHSHSYSFSDNSRRHHDPNRQLPRTVPADEPPTDDTTRLKVRGRKRASGLPGTLWTCALLAMLSPAMGEAQTPPRGPDFNRDGFDDIAIGAGQEDLEPIADAGMVSLGYGSLGGLTVPPGHPGWLNGDTPGLADGAEQGDLFGFALAWGDFNGDCFDDLAIGSFLEDLNGVDNAGALHVVYGSVNGPDPATSQFLHRGVPGVEGALAADAWFGSAVAAGDFNGDGFDDLAVAAEHDPIGAGINERGSVHIFYGSAGGLSTADDRILTRPALGFAHAPYFGRSLATGDFNCDGLDELAIGSPFADPEGTFNAGDVLVLSNLLPALNPTTQHWYQGNGGLGEVLEASDYLGTTLATGNFNGDFNTASGLQCLDLAIGVPLEDGNLVKNSGLVHVVYGSPVVGLQNAFPAVQTLGQATPGIADKEEFDDQLGDALVVGRFNNDNFDDLAVGVPGELLSAGSVAIWAGSATGIQSAGSELWNQRTPGISDFPEKDDRFGRSLGYASRLDFTGSTLLIGVPWETLGGVAAAGMVHAITLDSLNFPSFDLLSEQALEQSTFGGSTREFADTFGESLLAPRHKPWRSATCQPTGGAAGR